MYGLPVTGQLFLNFTQWNLLIPPIFSLPLSLPPETTKCIKSQGPQKPRGSLLVLSRRNLYEEQIKFTFWNGQTTQQPNQGKQKTKYSNSSKYFCYNTIIGLLLAINVSLSFSSPAQIYSQKVGQEAALYLNSTSVLRGHFLRVLWHLTHWVPV